MKNIITLLFIGILFVSCKSDKNKKNQQNLDSKLLSIPEKIANAYGFNNWDQVLQIEFTFNVDRDSSHFERSWKWNPKTNDVIMTLGNDSIFYNRNHLDSLSIKTDKGFINDKYWLLAPFQLLWDRGTSISEVTKAEAPIGAGILNKITLTYPEIGGYSPGDAYDFYFDDDYIIKEWVYRKANSQTPTLITTWENNQNFNGIKLALEHKKLEGGFKLYFSKVKISMN